MKAAAEWLALEREALARRVTELQYAASPQLAARHGAAGRERCHEDAVHHITHLERAVAQQEPALFADYVGWAKVLLSHLRIPDADLALNLRLLAQTVRESAPEEVRAAVTGILDDAIERFSSMPSEVESFIRPDAPLAALARRYLDAVLAGNRQEASQMVLQAVDAGTPIRDVYLHVFQTSQYEIGRLWQCNQITVAEEHYCTAATQLVMSQLYPRLFSGERRGRILVAACVAGDLHEIGLRIVTDFFEMAGWDTFYVGANTPTRSVLSAARQQKADLVALSTTMVASLKVIEDLIPRLRAEVPAAKILVGGRPFVQTPGLALRIGADGTAPDARRAIALAARMFPS